jgi:PPOX class probable F420-dependent enzyme
VRERLQEERHVWFTTVGRDGTPQPNPVWFLWNGADEILTYNRADAHRLAHIADRPQVSLHFNSDRAGNNVIVLRGIAEHADGEPPCDQLPEYLAKYGTAMANVSGSAAAFAATYSVPIRIRLTRVRGF